jgi:hypothetical protein
MFIDSGLDMNEKLNKAINVLKDINDDFNNEYAKVSLKKVIRFIREAKQ